MHLVIAFSSQEEPLVALMEHSLIAEHHKGKHSLCKEIQDGNIKLDTKSIYLKNTSASKS